MNKILATLSKNKTNILTGVSIAGVVGTGISTYKSTVKYIEDTKTCSDQKERIKMAITDFAPTILIGLATISSIATNAVMCKKRQAELISGYILLDKKFKSFKSKTQERYGETSVNGIETEIVKDTVKKEEPRHTSSENVETFFDPITETYFESTKEDVNNAFKEMNKLLNGSFFGQKLTLNEYCHYLGLPKVPMGNDIGWDASWMFAYYDTSFLSNDFYEVTTDDGIKCNSYYVLEPMLFDEMDDWL